MTTTTLDDLDPELRAVAAAWEVVPDIGGARLAGPVPPTAGTRATPLAAER